MGEFALNRVVFGDALKTLRKVPSGTFNACVTSPPYWGLRDYEGHPQQLGLEATPQQYVRKMVRVFREVRRVLRDDGTLWLNIGDCFAARGNGGGGKFMDERGETCWSAQASLKGFRKAPEGLKDKDLIGIPWMLAFALRADGWWLRSEIIWDKQNPMPESVKDRPTKAHEQVFLLSKSARYFYDNAAIAEPTVGRTHHDVTGGRYDAPGQTAHTGTRERANVPFKRNARDVWTIPSEPYHGAHFATFPTELARRCIVAGCPEGGSVIDPFFGSGTVGQVAETHGRRWFGIELVEKYAPLIAKRTAQVGMIFEPAESSNA